MNGANLFKNDARLILHFQPAIQLTENQFFHFCQLNRELRIEQTAEGDIEVMPPAGAQTSWRNAQLNTGLGIWARQDGSGEVFDSSTGFILPNGATRSPDVSWVKRSHLKGLSAKQKERFLPLCPDFVIELRSSSDSLKVLQNKMLEYIENGAQSGWLIDQKSKKVYIYRPDEDVECSDNPTMISGEPELPGFVLHLKRIWAGF